jgi:hypothetical protein
MLKHVVCLLLDSSSRLDFFMFSLFQCEPYIVMYTDNAENECFVGDSMELVMNLALPTLEGWAKAATGEIVALEPTNSTLPANSTTPANGPTMPVDVEDLPEEPTPVDAVDLIGFVETLSYKTGYKAGYSQALSVGFDNGYQSEMKQMNVGAQTDLTFPPVSRPATSLDSIVAGKRHMRLAGIMAPTKEDMATRWPTLRDTTTANSSHVHPALAPPATVAAIYARCLKSMMN